MLETAVQTRAMEFISQLSVSTPKLHLLVVDADPATRLACAEIAATLGYAVESTGDLSQVRSLLRGHAADILLVNLPSSGHSGLELVSEVRLLYPQLSVIAMTASGSVNNAVEAMRCGASDYLTKPFAIDEFSTVLDRAALNHTADTATRQLRERLRLSEGLGSIIGRSAEMGEALPHPLQGGSKHSSGSCSGRERNREGVGCSHDSRLWTERGEAIFTCRLRFTGSHANRERVVRLCQRSIHRRNSL